MVLKKKITFSIIGLLILSLLVVGCTSKADESSNEEIITLKVGATPVPHAELLEFVKPKLKEAGINLEIVEFTDYVRPNLALSEGEIDANFFQHAPYMESFAKEHNLELTSVAKIHVEPLGFYSKKLKSIDELSEGALIAIPNDPTNEGRALIFLDTNGIIKLKDDAGLEATESDIAENPKNLVFKPIDAAQLPRTLDDVDGAIINTNYALEAGLNPSSDALIIEGSESPYSNIITVTSENKDNELIGKLVEALQSEEVKEFILEKYEGAIVPTF